MEYVCFIGVLLWVVRSCNISLCALKMCGSLVVKKCNWHANSTVIFQLVELIADCWVGWTVLLSLGGLLECLIFLVHITIRLASTDDDRFIHICFFEKLYTFVLVVHILDICTLFTSWGLKESAGALYQTNNSAVLMQGCHYTDWWLPKVQENINFLGQQKERIQRAWSFFFFKTQGRVHFAGRTNGIGERGGHAVMQLQRQ